MESFGAQNEVLEQFSENKEKEPEKAPEEKAKDKKTAEKALEDEKTLEKDASVTKAKEKKPEVIAPVKKNKLEPKNKKASTRASSEEKKFPEDYPEELIDISKKAIPLWRKYDPRFYPGEKIIMDINYMGISTGKIVLTTEEETQIGNKKVFHVGARVKTSDYYSYLYELDDNVDSYISKANLLPVKFSLIQRESGQDIDDLQLFDHDKLTTYSFYQRVTKKKTKKKKTEKYTPTHFTDPLSVIWFLRGLPMNQGASFEVPIMNRGKIIMLKAVSKGIETIDTAIGRKQAYKIEAVTSYTGETLKSGDMTFWFSADDKRIFLKFNAKIKIGSISGDIEKYEE